MNVSATKRRFPWKIIAAAVIAVTLFSLPATASATLKSARSNFQTAASQAYGQELDTEQGLISIIGALVNTALGLLGVILLVLFIYGGFLWATAGGNNEQVDKAKKIMKNAVIGLIIALAAYSISYFVLTQMMTATGFMTDPNQTPPSTTTTPP